MMLKTVLLAHLFFAFASCRDIGGISGVRLSKSASIFNSMQDGLLEVKYEDAWGTVCQHNFDIEAASVACSMLGFLPKGFPILNHRLNATLAPVLTDLSCKEAMSQDTSSSIYHLGYCSLNDKEINHECQTVAITCLEKPQIITTTPVPNLARLPTVNCSSNISSNIRLINGNLEGSAGLLEVKHPETGIWGTVCAEGFGLYEAKTVCRMLCSESDLSYARPVLYSYGKRKDDQPIYLSQMSCPSKASSLNDCDLGYGWDYSGTCMHDVGIQCGPQESMDEEIFDTPEMNCSNDSAVVLFNKEKNPLLYANMITINNVNVECNFSSTDNGSFIIVRISLNTCTGVILEEIPEKLAIQYNLTRQMLSSETGLITALPRSFTVTCFIARAGSAQVQAVAQLPRPFTLAPVFAAKKIKTNLAIYTDSSLQNELDQPINMPPGTPVFVKISLGNHILSSKLVLNACWATRTDDPNDSIRRDLIVNKCPVSDSSINLRIYPLSSYAFVFSMPMFYLIQPNTLANGTSDFSLYLHCSTTVCHRSEKTERCNTLCTRN